MSEVEKLYKNAEVNQICDTFVHWMQCEWETRQCKDCEHFVYPPFTANKQLELLKICFDKYERLEKVRGLKERCIIYYHFESNGYKEFVNCGTWEETIAGLINNLWQDLTEEERKQIEKILK